MNPDDIDFVLVSSSARDDNSDVQEAREFYEGKLENEGLEMEKETYGCLRFVKIHAPKDVLRRYCEIMKFRMPLKKEPEILRSVRFTTKRNFLSEAILFLRSVIRYFKHGDLTVADLAEVNDEFKATYSRDKPYLFDEDDPNFFTPIIRILVVHYILNRQTLSQPFADGEPVGLKRLTSDNIYIAAYPLHDGNYQDEHTTRGKLFEKWCELRNLYRSQPLDDVQEYLGTKVAFYFAWLGFYMRLLIPASICGVLVLLYGLFTLSGDHVSQDICNSNVTMCPTCDYTCDYYQLSGNCFYSKITYLFDNHFTVVFAFLMAIWASTFLELWKRYDAFLTYRWSSAEYSVDEELTRPEYISRARRFKEHKENPVTEKPEPVIPFWKFKLPIRILGYTTILFFIMLAVIAVAAVLVYRMWVTAVINAMSYTSILKQYESFVISGTSAALNLISIMVLNSVYTKIAEYLTELELHRTATEHETALTIKTFMFQFVNYYSSIMYIAFFKGKFIGFPGHYWRIFGARQEECDYGGCLLELSIQLAFIMIGKQIISSFVEIYSPAFQKLLRTSIPKTTDSDIYLLTEAADLEKAPSNSRWIEDFKQLDWESVGLFPEYLKMVIQFGFVTLFVPAFPLAPLFAFLNNIFEVRLDARKILTYYRRPVPYQVPGIGVWFYILRFIGSLAVLTNGIVIAFSSNFIPALVYMMNNAGSDENFLINSLSVVNVDDLENATRPANSSYQDISTCYYTDFRAPPTSPMKYTPTHLYWQVFVARLIFIILFQNITYAVKSIIDFCIPDQPKLLQQLIRKENYRTVNLIVQRESELLAKAKVDASNDNETTDSFYGESTVHESFSEVPMQMLTSSLEKGVSKMTTYSSTAAQQQ